MSDNYCPSLHRVFLPSVVWFASFSPNTTPADVLYRPSHSCSPLKSLYLRECALVFASLHMWIHHRILCFHHHEPHMAVVQSVIDPRCFVLSGLLAGRANDTGVMEPDNIIRQPDIRSKKSAEDMWWLQSDEWLETNIQTIKKSLCHQFFFQMCTHLP